MFDDDMELELASHIEKLADQFHGQTALKCRDLAFESTRMEFIFQKTGQSKREHVSSPFN